MDIFANFIRDHRQALALLENLTTKRDRAARIELLVELQGLLLAHNQIEEAVLYAMPAQFDDARVPADQIARQHENDEELLAALCGARNEADWAIGLAALHQALDRHFAAEEETIFAGARRHLDHQTLDRTIAALRVAMC